MKKTNLKDQLLSQTFTVKGLNAENLSFSAVTDVTPGLLIPIASIPTLPRDRFSIDMDSFTHALVASNPILNNFKVRISAFFIPDRLYVPELARNFSSTPSPLSFSDAELPSVVTPPAYLTANIPEGSIARRLGVAPRSIMNYMGLPVGYCNTAVTATPTVNGRLVTWPSKEEYVNCLDGIAYLDIVRNYFLNLSSDNCAFINGQGYQAWFTANDTQPTQFLKPGISWGSISQFEANFDAFLKDLTDTEDGLRRFFGLPYPYENWNSVGKFASLVSTPNGGLFVKSMPQDFINARTSSFRFESAIAKSLVQISDGKLNMQDLIDGRRLFDYYTKAAFTNGRFDQWIKAEYGLDVTSTLDIPLFLRTWSYDVGFQPLYGTADSSNSESFSYLGSQAGQGGGSRPSMRLRYNSKENGRLMFILSIEPDVIYSQTVNPFLRKLYYSDYHTPSFDRMGMQSVPADQVNALARFGFKNLNRTNSKLLSLPQVSPYFESADSGIVSFVDKSNSDFGPIISLGYQPAWCEYRFNYSRAYGDLGNPANVLSTWVSSPHYGLSPLLSLQDYVTNIGDFDAFTTYSLPSEWLTAFPDTTAGSAPFLTGINFKIKAFRTISHNQIQSL